MTAIICNVLSWLQNLIVTRVPAMELGDGVLSSVIAALDTFLDFVSNVNWLVPVNDCLLIISLIVGYRLALFAVFVINWVLRRIFDIIP